MPLTPSAREFVPPVPSAVTKATTTNTTTTNTTTNKDDEKKNSFSQNSNSNANFEKTKTTTTTNAKQKPLFCRDDEKRWSLSKCNENNNTLLGAFEMTSSSLSSSRVKSGAFRI